MIMKNGFSPLVAVAAFALSASLAIAQTVPIESSEIGYVNATKGDSRWDTFYCERPDFAGVARSHFQKTVGEDLGNAAADHRSALWSATVAARKDGVHRFRLTGNVPASVEFDGDQKMSLAEPGEKFDFTLRLFVGGEGWYPS